MSNKLGKFALAMFILIFSGNYVVFAQEATSDLKKEIEELKQGQNAIQEELKTIKKLLLIGQRPDNKPVRPQVNIRDIEFDLGNNPSKGNDSAQLVLVEFSDYQCTFCARHTKETYPEIYKNYINTGKLRHVIIDNPLPFHKMAPKAAEAAHCAAEQGSFWEMHDEMMASPETVNDLNKLASMLDLDMQKFSGCMDENKYADKVSSNITLAKKLNILSVPGFVIASGDSDNPQKVKGISYIRGAMPFSIFQKEIDQALASLSK